MVHEKNGGQHEIRVLLLKAITVTSNRWRIEEQRPKTAFRYLKAQKSVTAARKWDDTNVHNVLGFM